MAAGLLSLGLKRGDRIGIWGPNSYEWLLTQWAAARAGFILVIALDERLGCSHSDHIHCY